MVFLEKKSNVLIVKLVLESKNGQYLDKFCVNNKAIKLC